MPLQEEFESQGSFLFRYRGTLPLLFLIAGLLVFGINKYFAVVGGDLSKNDIWLWISLLTGLLGLFIRVYTVGHTPKNTSGRNTGKQLADELNSSGIYSIVRHPLYLGNFSMWLAIAILTESIWLILVFALVYWVYYERIMFTEEQFLRRKFGEEYLMWASRTPAFIPAFTHFAKPKMKFSWKKVLKKEKNGFFALFLIMFLFKTLEIYLIKKTYLIEENWLLVLTVFSGLLYFVLRIIKNRTRLLDEDGM